MDTHKYSDKRLDFMTRVVGLLNADPVQLRRIDAILTTAPDPYTASLTLLTFQSAAERLNIARSTIERLVEEGTLPTIELRRGRRRIRESDLRKLVYGDDQS